MIQDLMSKSFVVLSGRDKIGTLVDLLRKNEDIEYVVIAYPNRNFCALESTAARDALKRTGERMGKVLLDLRLDSIPVFHHLCSFVNIRDSELVALAEATRCPEKQIVVLENDRPVGVVKARVRAALFSAMPATLYGERFDIFEKGRVKPKYPLHCRECHASFDFYEPVIKAEKIIYCCPECKCILEE